MYNYKHLVNRVYEKQNDQNELFYFSKIIGS